MIRIHLSKLLGERRWSQADIARRTGIRATTINEIYHNIIPRVNIEHLDKICEALDCKLSDLMEYVPNEKTATGKDLILEPHGNRKKTT